MLRQPSSLVLILITHGKASGLTLGFASSTTRTGQRQFISIARLASHFSASTRNKSLSQLSSSPPPPPAATSTSPPTSKSSHTRTNNDRLFPEELNVIYDSQCNVCKWEVEFLKRRDLKRHQGRPRIKFTDLEGVDTGPYNPHDPANANITYPQALASMHAVTYRGDILKGVPVFIKAYELVGLGWLWSLTQVLPGGRQILNRLYALFARHRTKLTRGATIDELVQTHNTKQPQWVQRKQPPHTETCGDRCVKSK
jgi:predicted DCC family thiol-disulfide oxidoreductase YuxK